jgi:predicted dehydrogenase
MKDPVRFGIVGTGRMAETMLRTLSDCPHAKVVAVLSDSPERASQFAQRAGIAAWYGDLRQFMENEAIDAVYVANGNERHAATSLAALRAGKSVLCEKPMSIDVAEARAVAAAARETRQLFMEAMWTQLLPAYRRLARLVEAGTFGKPTHLRFDFGYPISRTEHPSLFAATGGVLLDRAVYGIAFALGILGPVAAVDASVGRATDSVDLEASLLLSHRHGGQSQLSVSFTSLMSNSAAVACERGVIRLDPPTIGSESISYQRASFIQSDRPAGKQGGIAQGAKAFLRRQPLLRRIRASALRRSSEFHSFGSDPYAHQLRHFIRLFHERRTESEINTMDLSLSTMEVVETARASARISTAR